MSSAPVQWLCRLEGFRRSGAAGRHHCYKDTLGMDGL